MTKIWDTGKFVIIGFTHCRWMSIKGQLVQWHAAKNNDFLLNTVTDNERQFHNFDPRTKEHGMAPCCISRGAAQNHTLG
jgi:hypothetical protein